MEDLHCSTEIMVKREIRNSQTRSQGFAIYQYLLVVLRYLKKYRIDVLAFLLISNIELPKLFKKINSITIKFDHKDTMAQ